MNLMRPMSVAIALTAHGTRQTKTTHILPHILRPNDIYTRVVCVLNS